MRKKYQVSLIFLILCIQFLPTYLNTNFGSINQISQTFFPRAEVNPYESMGDNAYGPREWDIVAGDINPPEGEYYKCLLSSEDGCNVNHPWNDYTPDYYYLYFPTSNSTDLVTEIVNIRLIIDWLSFGPKLEVSVILGGNILKINTLTPKNIGLWNTETINLTNVNLNDLETNNIVLRLLKIGTNNAVHIEFLYIELFETSLSSLTDLQITSTITLPSLSSSIESISNSPSPFTGNFVILGILSIFGIGIIALTLLKNRRFKNSRLNIQDELFRKKMDKNDSGSYICQSCGTTIYLEDKYCFVCGERQ